MPQEVGGLRSGETHTTSTEERASAIFLFSFWSVGWLSVFDFCLCLFFRLCLPWCTSFLCDILNFSVNGAPNLHDSMATYFPEFNFRDSGYHNSEKIESTAGVGNGHFPGLLSAWNLKSQISTLNPWKSARWTAFSFRVDESDESQLSSKWCIPLGIGSFAISLSSCFSRSF